MDKNKSHSVSLTLTLTLTLTLIEGEADSLPLCILTVLLEILVFGNQLTILLLLTRILYLVFLIWIFYGLASFRMGELIGIAVWGCGCGG
jgi:hypothetical protein